MRTLLSLLMVAALVFGSVSMLAGCQNTDNTENNNDNGNNNNALDYVGLEEEEYLQKLASNNLGTVVDSLGEVYGAFLGGASSGSVPEKMGAKVSMTVTVGDTALELLEQGIFGGDAPVSIDFLKEINLDMDVAMNGQMQAMELALGLKGQHIAAATVLMNLADSVIYAAVPELNDQWIKLEAGGTDMPTSVSGIVASPAMLAELAAALPDAQTLTKVLDRYLNLILAELDNVEQSNTTLEVNGVKQNCTLLTLKVYEADALAAAKAVLTAAKDDADLKKIITDAVKAVAEMAGETMDANEVYADFKETVEDALADLNEVTETDTETPIQLDTYVDKNHNIIGMKLHSMSTQDSNRGMFYFYSLTQGDKTAFEFAVPSDVNDGDDFKISGTGNKNGGTYTISVQGQTLATAKLEDMTEEGGTITLTPGANLLPAEVTDMLGELSLQIKLSADGIALNLKGGNEVLLGLAIKAVESNGPSMNAPSDAVDATNSSAMEQWAEKLAMDKLLENLEKAGAYEFFEALFQAQEAPAQPMPEFGYGVSDEGWG